MKAPLVILAGGKGTRLGELTKDTPKPMVDVCGKPFLHWLVQKYIAEGFDNIVISTGYKAEVIENYTWPECVTLVRDNAVFNGSTEFYKVSNVVVVNGDTWIRDALPTDTSGPWILSYISIDAGAQYVSTGKIRMINTGHFFDIGTPQGLTNFREYFKTQVDKN